MLIRERYVLRWRWGERRFRRSGRQQAVAGGVVHGRSHVGHRWTVAAERDRRPVAGGEAKQPLTVNGDHPLGRLGDHVNARFECDRLPHRDRRDHTGGQRWVDDMVGRFTQLDGQPNRLATARRAEVAADGRQSNGVGLGEAEIDLGDARCVPDRTGTDPVHGEDGDVDQGILHPITGDDGQLLGLVGTGGPTLLIGGDQPGGQTGHCRFDRLGEGIVRSGGDRHQRDVGRLRRHQSIGAVATDHHDGSDAGGHHGPGGGHGVGLAPGQRLFDEVEAGPGPGGTPLGQVEQPHHDPGTVGHHDGSNDTGRAQTVQKALQRVDLVVDGDCSAMSHDAANVAGRGRIGDDSNGRWSLHRFDTSLLSSLPQ